MDKAAAGLLLLLGAWEEPRAQRKAKRHVDMRYASAVTSGAPLKISQKSRVPAGGGYACDK